MIIHLDIAKKICKAVEKLAQEQQTTSSEIVEAILLSDTDVCNTLDELTLNKTL